MKKALFIITFTAVLAGCKKEMTVTSESVDSTATDLPATDAAPPKCTRTIVINSDAVDPNWDASIECKPGTELKVCKGTACVHAKKYIDLDLINDGIDARSVASLQKQSEWLQNHQAVICYAETEPYLANTHLVKDVGLITELENVPDTNWTPFTKTQIVNAIAAANGDYATGKHTHYLAFKTVSGKLQIYGRAGYNVNSDGYSVPLLRGIETCNQFYDADPKWEFIEAKGTHFLRIYVKDPNGGAGKISKFYDYSKLPDKADVAMTAHP